MKSKPVQAEIDQSGRVEDLTSGTVIAFSNSQNGTIFISAGNKREVVQFLKSHPLYFPNFAPLFFTLLVFLLVRNEQLQSIRIDEEYTGKEEYIVETLEKLFRNFTIPCPRLVFARIGKHSPAHELAIINFRKKGRYATKKISVKEVIGLLQIKQAGSKRRTHRVSR